MLSDEVGQDRTGTKETVFTSPVCQAKDVDDRDERCPTTVTTVVVVVVIVVTIAAVVSLMWFGFGVLCGFLSHKAQIRHTFSFLVTRSDSYS